MQYNSVNICSLYTNYIAAVIVYTTTCNYEYYIIADVVLLVSDGGGAPIVYIRWQTVQSPIKQLSAMASSSLTVVEPSARYRHAAVSFGRNMLVWGGEGDSTVPSSVESYSVSPNVWQKPRKLRGQSLPNRLRHMAVASDGERAYFFGGWIDARGLQRRSNALYVLDLSSRWCRELVAANAEESPSPRGFSAMVYRKRTLVLYGGDTEIISDELFVFDLDTSEL